MKTLLMGGEGGCKLVQSENVRVEDATYASLSSPVRRDATEVNPLTS